MLMLKIQIIREDGQVVYAYSQPLSKNWATSIGFALQDAIVDGADRLWGIELTPRWSLDDSDAPKPLSLKQP